MRYLGIVALAAIVTAAPASAGIIPLPEEGLNFKGTGFTIHLPGKPWFIQTNYRGQSIDGSVEGNFPLQMGASGALSGNPLVSMLGLGNDSTAFIDVSGSVAPVVARDPQGVVDLLMDLAKTRADTDAAQGGRIHYVSSEFSMMSVNGAPCVRWESVAEDRGVPHHKDEVFTLSMHRLLCSDPEFPAFIVRIDYSTRRTSRAKLVVPDADGLGVLASFKFTHLGYRVSQIAVGAMPQYLAETDGAIWVAYGYDSGKVARIDPKTNTVTAVIPVGRVPIGVVADASGLWIANHMDDTVSRIDPKTDKVIATIKVPKGPEIIAAGAGSIWVTASGARSVARIDPTTGSVIEISGVGEQPAGIAFAGGSIYVTDYNSDKIARINPATNKVEGHIAGAFHSNVLVPDGRYLWANNQDKISAVLRLDPATPDAAPVKFSKAIAEEPTGIAQWNGKLWVANWGGATVSILDPKMPEVGENFSRWTSAAYHSCRPGFALDLRTGDGNSSAARPGLRAVSLVTMCRPWLRVMSPIRCIGTVCAAYPIRLARAASNGWSISSCIRLTKRLVFGSSA